MNTMTMSTKPHLFDQLTYPEHVKLHDGTLVRTLDIARAVADDAHPADDSISAFWLRESARASVKKQKLATLIREAGGTLDLTDEVMPSLVDCCTDELQCLSNAAISDVVEDVDSLNGCSLDDAARILLLGALLFEKEQAR